jgi:predicted DNA-binding ribbon-helix-helix protein
MSSRLWRPVGFIGGWRGFEEGLFPLTYSVVGDSIPLAGWRLVAMAKAVDIPDEIYMRLHQQAQDRGITVAQLIAQLQEEAQRARLAAAIASLHAKGLLLTVAAQSGVTDFDPVSAEGVSLSEVVLRERR